MTTQVPAVGIVKWFDCKKGYGFLIDDQGQDVFVHHTVIAGEGFRRLRDGERVTYEAISGPKGFSAVWVRQIKAQTADTRPSAPVVTMVDAVDGPLHPSLNLQRECFHDASDC